MHKLVQYEATIEEYSRHDTMGSTMLLRFEQTVWFEISTQWVNPNERARYLVKQFYPNAVLLSLRRLDGGE